MFFQLDAFEAAYPDGKHNYKIAKVQRCIAKIYSLFLDAANKEGTTEAIRQSDSMLGTQSSGTG